MSAALFILVDGVVLIAGVLTLRAGEHERWRRRLQAFVLEFPYGTKPEAVTNFLEGLSGLAAPQWRQAVSVRGVVFETVATPGGISHRLLVPNRQADIVLSALRAHLPGARVTALEDPPRVPVTLAAQLGLSNGERTLNTRAAVAVSGGLLASLQPLAAGQSIVVQLIVQPGSPVNAVSPVTSTRRDLWRRLFTAPAETVDLATRRAKHAHSAFLVTPRIGVTAGSPGARRALLGRVLASFHAANAPGVHLFRRHVPKAVVMRNLTGRYMPLLVAPCPLNAAELGMCVGIPLGEVALPGLRLGTSRLLAPASDIARTGRVVAMSSFPGSERPLALSVPDSLRHLHVIGPTGVGKSTLLLNLITQDMQAGRGVVVIDPKGDLAADVIDRVPENRVKDVVILDAADEACPVGFNILAGARATSELLVDQVVGTLHNLFKANWGPRTDDILRAALLTLVQEPGMTLCEVPLLLTDANFRRRLVGRIDDPVALGPFWSWYESISEPERTAAIGPVLNKLRQFLLRRSLRNVLGQATPRLDLGKVLRDGQILIVPLTKGLLGEEAAALLGSLLIARLWQTVMARAGRTTTDRRPVFAYIDEFQDYLHLPTDVADVLAQARGLALGLTLAHQHLGQLPPKLRDAVLANARSRVIFQSAAADARLLGREVAPYLSPADLQGLGAYEVVATLSAGNRIAPPATGQTLPSPGVTGYGAAVRERSRAAYGTPRDDVETAIRSRHSERTGSGPVGRREVS